MSILGSLIVELRAETASFVAGLTGASKTAKTVGREIEESFSSLGGVATAALAPFGEFGSFLGETLEGVGRSAQLAIGVLGKMGGGVAPLAVGLGAVAGAMAAVTAGVVGLAVHTALMEAELGEMSQKTGVSTQTLAGLGLAARETGVPMESLAKALEFMNSNAVKAAIGPKGVATAFSRLGVDVKDTTGQIRDSTAIFTDLFAKISTLPQPEQGYFAKAIFGKGGAAILPLLNLTEERLGEIVRLAKDLDLGNPQTVAASQKFKETVEDIKAEFEGMALQLTKQMLPAIQFLASHLEEAFKSGSIQKFIGYLTWIAKETIVLGDELFHVFEQIGILFEGIGGAIIATFNGIGAVIEATAKASIGDFSGAWAALKAGAGGFKDAWNDASGAMKKSFADQKAFKDGIWSQQTLFPPPPAHRGHADLDNEKGDTTLDRIRERLKALGEEAAGWANIAKVGTQAEQLIAEAIQKGNVEFSKLKEQAAKDKTGASLPFVNQNEGLIKTAEAMKVFGAAVKPVTADLDKQSLKMGEQSKLALEMAAAYNKGGSAIADAFVGSKFAEQAGKLDVLVQAHTLAVSTFGKESPATKLLAQAIDELTRSLGASVDGARKLVSAQLTEELAKQSNSFRAAKPYLDALSDSYSKSEDAIRAARIQMELAKFAQDQLDKGVNVNTATVDLKDDQGKTTETITLLERKRRILQETSDEDYANKLKESAAQFNINFLYDEQIVKLQRVKAVMQANNDNTLLIDARLFSAQQQLIKQWDDAAFATGTFAEKTRGFFNEIILEGQNAGKQIMQAFVGAYDSATGALAKLATGQKADFKSIFQGLAEQVTKAEIQKGIGSLVSSLGLGGIPGLSAKADGSEHSPFWVRLKESGALGGGGLFGGGSSNPLSNLGALFGGGQTSIFSKIAGLFGGGSSSSGGFGDAANFGGNVAMFANGGDILPGHWGVTGEKGPEVVKGPATVIPMEKLGGGHKTSITNNFPVFKDYDMFRRSGPQLMAHQHRQMSIAYSRS